MKKLILFSFITLLFTTKTNAQKAYDLVIYKGVWGNFNITLNYGYGYESATEIISIHKKNGGRKKYSFDYEKGKEGFIYFTNPSNKTIFGLRSIEDNDTPPKRITVTIFFNGTQEDFTVYKK